MADSQQLAISDTFFTAFAALPKQQQKKVNEFIHKFRANSKSSGLHLEKIIESRSKNLRSARVDQTYRAIIFQPDKGSSFILLWVDHHDKAYEWAKRYSCQIHPSTGVIQIIDTTYVEKNEVISKKALKVDAFEASPTVPVLTLFRDYSNQQLLELGVPEVFIDRVLQLTDDVQLEMMEKVLPADAYEPLYLLAAGTPYDELLADLNEVHGSDIEVDTEDFDAALHRAGSKSRFMLVEDDIELEQMLNAPLEKWRVFLHPSQRKLVNRNWNGPVRVSGGAGTGKTVVAMHRARWLAEQLSTDSNKKILFTTFTKNLAADIEHNLNKICTPEVMKRIEVVNIDRWIYGFLKRHKYSYNVVYDYNNKREACWKTAMNLKPTELSLTDNFYQEEWRLVVQPQNIFDMKSYFKAKRVGRGTSLTRPQRAKIWPVFEEYRNQLNFHNIKEMPDAMVDVVQIIEQKSINMPYASVVVDEAQDMGMQAFKLLRKVVPEQANDMFIVGDGHQRIYSRKVVLGQCGVNIRGRGRKLKINYRTTEETRRFAVSILNGVTVDNLDGEDDRNDDYLSLFHGDDPFIKCFDSQDEERTGIHKEIKTLLDEGVPQKDICLVARTDYVRQPYIDMLENNGLSTYLVQRNGIEDRNVDGIRIASMHRVKGLEFQFVFIVAVNDGVVPYYRSVSEDPVEQRELEFNERALLHVAATRAVKRLYVSSSGKPSKFIG
ncbi:UvrD-helicase domain-containing protein [Vibrio albus]|nr:UvrD-helicase domain-containing protein [Vibrio albus]